MPHKLSRFLTRVWKKVYRNAGSCPCATCREVEKNWLVIADEQHAKHLYQVQVDRDTDWEWILWNEYRDTP